ncbi:MAG: Ig-like domain repeat protein [Actinobacteria bacterium]|nr:Ig-like domain repeat protein [Actinomycetota bacterium]
MGQAQLRCVQILSGLVALVALVALCAGLLAPAQPASAAGLVPLAVPTVTTLTAQQSPTVVNLPDPLTATVLAEDGTAPAGTVQFTAGATNLGAVPVDATGVAKLDFTPSDAGTILLSAVFTPDDPTYAPSTATLQLIVAPCAGCGFIAGSSPITFTVPQVGTLTVTVAPGTVDLAVSGTTATGSLQDVTVTDTRNFVPGWSVSGQDSPFMGSGPASGFSIPADQLGWIPTGFFTGGATAGPPVLPGTSPGGLGDTPHLLASAPAGQGLGTNVLTAALNLDIPAGTTAGPYTSDLTITYLESGP